MKKEKTKWYEVEVASTTYRNYEIEAKSKEKAEEIALDLMDEDWDISKAWRDNAEVTFCEQIKLDKDGVHLKHLLAPKTIG